MHSRLVLPWQQTAWIPIRLLRKEQSDLGPYVLQDMLPKYKSGRESRQKLSYIAEKGFISVCIKSMFVDEQILQSSVCFDNLISKISKG